MIPLLQNQYIARRVPLSTRDPVESKTNFSRRERLPVQHPPQYARNMSDRAIIGAMSGTSVDGVDAALVAISGRGINISARLLLHFHCPYPPQLRHRIFSARSAGTIALSELADLGRDISLLYAAAVRGVLAEANYSTHDVVAVAAHGQTLYHAPPNTIQWLDPALLAAETGLAVISDFRRADCAAGGQGAPLVPFADYLLFSHPTRDRVLLNIGGIANFSYLPAGGGAEDLVAFDAGPGNCISDYFCRTFDPLGPGFDAGGGRAGLAIANRPVCDAFLKHPHFAKPPPKSTDSPEMIDAFLAASRGKPLPFDELLATASLATALAVVDGIARFCSKVPDELIVSGGGTENAAIMSHVRESAAKLGIGSLTTTDELGIPSAAKEAVAFAILGAATLDGVASNVPAATGAKRRAVLGSITPAPVSTI